MTRVSRVAFALAAGCLAAGALEFLRTLRALGNLGFVPSVDNVATFTSWTSAMVWSSIAVLASGALLTMAEPRSRAAAIAIIDAGVLTVILAARAWENIGGYLIPNDEIPFEPHPLPLGRWPAIYRHPWLIIGLVFLLAIAAAAYGGWRNRPTLFAVIAGVALTLIVVIAGGQFGFATVSFLRLRNWTSVVAVANLVAAALVIRRRRDVVLLVPLALLIAAAVFLAMAWEPMRGEIPPGNSIPWW